MENISLKAAVGLKFLVMGVPKKEEEHAVDQVQALMFLAACHHTPPACSSHRGPEREAAGRAGAAGTATHSLEVRPQPVLKPELRKGLPSLQTH